MGVARTPKQERARITVDAILEATRRVVSTEGLSALTTNRVAKVAGVSVGSVYQYFPNKDALIDAAYNQATERAWGELPLLLEQMHDQPLEVLARASIRLTIQFFREQPGFYAVVVARMSQQQLSGLSIGGEEPLLRAIRTVLLRRRAQLNLGIDIELASWVLTRTILHMCYCAVCERPALLEDEAFLDELTQLTVGYLSRR